MKTICSPSAGHVVLRLGSAWWLVVVCTGLLGAVQPTAAWAQAKARAKGADSAATAVDTVPAEGPRHVRVSESAGIAAAHGQLWRDYDLRPYLERVPGLTDPHRPIVDWILRETGTDRWFGDVPGMLALEPDQLRVYHVPEVQQTVAEIVDRFVDPDLSGWSVSVRLVTVESAAWRSAAWPLLRPVTVQTPGVEAWLLTQEQAAMLTAQLRSRLDCHEHNAGRFEVGHGQAHTVERWQPRSYPRSAQPVPGQRFGYQIDMGQLREGYSLHVSPLARADEETMDMVVKCAVDQIERLTPIWLTVPSADGTQSNVEVDVPQVSSWRLHERFRWPRNEVLVVSPGVVAPPAAKRPARIPLPVVLPSSPARADTLLIFECRAAPTRSLAERQPQTRVVRLNDHGRY
jgi:hypothetical protein